MKKKKKSYFVDQDHRLFITRNKCILYKSDTKNCLQYNGVDEFGEGICDPCHITQRGMGGKNHGVQYEHNNLIPLCRYHHNEFDQKWTKEEREGLRKIAIILTEYYLTIKNVSD